MDPRGLAEDSTRGKNLWVVMDVEINESYIKEWLCFNWSRWFPSSSKNDEV